MCLGSGGELLDSSVAGIGDVDEAVLVDPGEAIETQHFPFAHDGPGVALPSSVPAVPATQIYEDETYHDARGRIISEFEVRYLTSLVNQTAGNMSKAARIAGVDRTTLYRLMEKHGLTKEAIVAPGA